MLVIRRAEGESILIAGAIEICVLQSWQGKTLLGIKAPREIVVLRKEVAETRDLNLAAAANAERLRTSDLANLYHQTR